MSISSRAVTSRPVAPCADGGRVVVGRLQLLARLQAVVEADLDAFRDELRDAVDDRRTAGPARGPSSRVAAFAASLPNVMICATRSRPYFVDHVLHHALAAVHREVDVDVGHRLAARVEEALEQQVVADRVDVGDAQRVGHQRAGGRAAARARRRCRSPWRRPRSPTRSGSSRRSPSRGSSAARTASRLRSSCVDRAVALAPGPASQRRRQVGRTRPRRPARRSAAAGCRAELELDVAALGDLERRAAAARGRTARSRAPSRPAVLK